MCAEVNRTYNTKIVVSWQIAFTGSFATGSKVMTAAAQLVKVIIISEICAIFF